MKYIVKRAHQGDQWYDEGDEREANEADVKHLVDNGVLAPTGAKAEPAAKNKAEPKARNKAG